MITHLSFPDLNFQLWVCSAVYQTVFDYTQSKLSEEKKAAGHRGNLVEHFILTNCGQLFLEYHQ